MKKVEYSVSESKNSIKIKDTIETDQIKTIFMGISVILIFTWVLTGMLGFIYSIPIVILSGFYVYSLSEEKNDILKSHSRHIRDEKIQTVHNVWNIIMFYTTIGLVTVFLAEFVLVLYIYLYIHYVYSLVILIIIIILAIIRGKGVLKKKQKKEIEELEEMGNELALKVKKKRSSE